jgi:antitoxin VapB
VGALQAANDNKRGAKGRWRFHPCNVACMVYIYGIYQYVGAVMSETGIAKIFMHGRSQAVRLPLAFRLPGDRVRVKRVEGGILLEPMVTDIDAWLAELDRFSDVPFMEDGRREPPMPEAEDLFA